jgi:proteasome ATPase
MRALRAASPAQAEELDRFLLAEVAKCRGELGEARQSMVELRAALEKLGSPPMRSATFVESLAGESCARAIVRGARGDRSVVGLGPGIDPASIRKGDEVFLSPETGAIVEVSPVGPARTGETAAFDRWTEDGRMILLHRDEKLVVEPADALVGAAIRAGDFIRYDRDAWLALERIDRREEKELFLQEAPDIGPESVGGQKKSLDALLAALGSMLLDRERAERYGLIGAKCAILLEGPPGTGKTLMARACAGALARTSGRRVRFGVVKPAEWESMWVGETTRRIRRTFQALRESAEDGLSVLFLDEIDAVGRARGGPGAHHADRHLAALLAELDGFASLRNVAVIAATNRLDLLDAAIVQRLSELHIRVERPTMREAREILAIHLPEGLPYQSGGDGQSVRAELIETAVSLFYAPNAPNEIAAIKLRDGATRQVAARELASGRMFEQIGRGARRSAFMREIEGGAPGIGRGDIERAVVEAFAHLRKSLSPRNARTHLADLPQDVDVVAVEPMAPKARRPLRHLNGAA